MRSPHYMHRNVVRFSMRVNMLCMLWQCANGMQYRSTMRYCIHTGAQLQRRLSLKVNYTRTVT